MSGYPGACRKGCCWTPQDVCAKHGGCSCHSVRESYAASLEAERERLRRGQYEADNWAKWHRED